VSKEKPFKVIQIPNGNNSYLKLIKGSAEYVENEKYPVYNFNG